MSQHDTGPGPHSRPLLRRFTVATLIAFSFVGFSISQLIADRVRKDALDTAQFHAGFVEETIVSPALSEADLLSPMSGDKLKRFDAVARVQALRAGVVRLKIWSPEGTILYSDRHELIGQSFENLVPRVTRVLADEVLSETSDLDAPQYEYERELGSLYSTMVPLTPDGAARPVAVAEFFQLEGPIESRINSVRAAAFAIVFGGLALLYAAVIPLLRRQAGLVLHQNQELTLRAQLLEQGQIQTIQMLNRLANAKDPYTGGHIGRVGELSHDVGVMMGVTKEQLRALDLAAEFHDIGKVAISDAILRKPGPLTAEERAEIEQHPAIGVGILEGSELFKDALPGILHHHERFDGTGYPARLAGRGIPVIARIITAVDSYDAMTSDRPYRKALPEEEAWRRLFEGVGSQFCPNTVAALASVLGALQPAEAGSR